MLVAIEKKLCPYCAELIPSKSKSCIRCGKDLQDAYLVVPDGVRYGIALGGEIKLHGLELKRAREIASILNSTKGY